MSQNLNIVALIGLLDSIIRSGVSQDVQLSSTFYVFYGVATHLSCKVVAGNFLLCLPCQQASTANSDLEGEEMSEERYEMLVMEKRRADLLKNKKGRSKGNAPPSNPFTAILDRRLKLQSIAPIEAPLSQFKRVEKWHFSRRIPYGWCWTYRVAVCTSGALQIHADCDPWWLLQRLGRKAREPCSR